MKDKTYFKGVTKIGLDDWNSIYVEAHEGGLIQDRKELLPEDAQFSPDIFETVIEDTDGGLYTITALMPADSEAVVIVEPFEKEIV